MSNIVLIIDDLLGGGAQRSTIKIATAFVDEGYNVTLIVLKNIVEFDVDERINLKQLNFKKGFISILAYYKFTSKLKKILNDIESKSGHICFLAGSLGLTHKLMNMASLEDAYYMLRGTTSNAKIGDRQGIKKTIKSKKIKKLYDNKNLLCVSKGVEEDILGLGVVPKSIQTIYNPYDFNLIKQLANKEIAFKIPTREYLVHVGRFAQLKRHDILIKAFSKIKNKSLLLVLVGEGKEKKNIVNLISELDLYDRVIFAGFQSNPYPIIKNARLLLLTSDNEGLPTVLIEALVLGVKVISTNCPSGPFEILAPKFKHYLTPVGDYKKLAIKMDEVLEEKSNEIPESIIKPFEANSVIAQYKELLH